MKIFNIGTRVRSGVRFTSDTEVEVGNISDKVDYHYLKLDSALILIKTFINALIIQP